MSVSQLKEIAQDFTVLYVEDEVTIRNSLGRYLEKIFKKVDTASDGEKGLELYKLHQYDMVITDINMPQLSGLEMSAAIKEINEYQNIIIISAYSDSLNFVNSIKIGIDGYIVKPIDYTQLNMILYKVSDKIKKFNENKEYKENLELLVEERTKDVQELQKSRIENYKKTLYALVKMVEDRDTYTGGHSFRVAQYSKMIAQNLKLDKEQCNNIYEAGILHDIGKVAIPDNVLLKPGGLNDLEYKLIQDHVNIGVAMLEQVPMFQMLSKFIKGHHERLDGSGYPDGLKGDEIPLESQIMAVSDTFDAMTTSRIYKARKTIDEALKEIESLEGKFFRPEVVRSALKVLKEVHIDANISQFPITQIEKERFSYFYKDQILQCYNSSYLDLVLIKNTHQQYKYLYQISVHNLSRLNKTKSWNEGNNYLIDIVTHLTELFKGKDIFRVFSDDFIIMSEEKIEIDTRVLEEFILVDGITFMIYSYDILNEHIDSFQALERNNKDQRV